MKELLDICYKKAEDIVERAGDFRRGDNTTLWKNMIIGRLQKNMILGGLSLSFFLVPQRSVLTLE